MAFSNVLARIPLIRFVASLLLLGGLAGCGGSGNRPPALQAIADQVAVTNRSIATWRVQATDIDSTLLYYTATYTLPGLGLTMPGMIPGLSINKYTGQISGSPTKAGNYTTTITVTDGDGATDSRSFIFEVVDESFSARVNTRLDGATVVNELVFTASDTSRAGTVAYCISADAVVPKADDACFKTDAEGGRTQTVAIAAGAVAPRRYLFTKNASGSVLSGSIPSAPFASNAWSAFTAGSVNPVIGVQTTAGTFAIELDSAKAPISTANFLGYVDGRFFDGTVFHRISKTFVIQGGGYLYDANATPKYSLKTGLNAPIALEKTSDTGLSNLKGTVAMARSGDPNSATSQFFINVVDNAGLDSANSADGNGYAVFGRVIWGMTETETGRTQSAVDALLATPVQASDILGGENSMPVGTPPSVLYMLRMN